MPVEDAISIEDQDLLKYGFCDDECYLAVRWSIVNVEVLTEYPQSYQTASRSI